MKIPKNNFGSIKAIIFDLDWTLYDSTSYYHQCLRAVSEIISEETGKNVNRLYQNLINSWNFKGPTYNRLFDDWLREFEMFTEQRLQKCIKSMRSNNHYNIDCYFGIHSFLHELRGRYKLGLLTEGQSGTQRNKIDKLKVGKYFDEVLVTQDIGFDKLSGRPLLHLIHSLNLTPEEVLSVGDVISKDILPALNVGSSAVHIKTNPFEIEKNHQLNFLSLSKTTDLVNYL